MEDVCEDIREGTVSGTGLLCCPPQGRPDCFQKGRIGGGHTGWQGRRKNTGHLRSPRPAEARKKIRQSAWKIPLGGGGISAVAWGRGGALVHESSGVVTSCSAGDVSAGASRARVGEVELAQQLGRVFNLRLEAVIVWGGEGGCELR